MKINKIAAAAFIAAMMISCGSKNEDRNSIEEDSSEYVADTNEIVEEAGAEESDEASASEIDEAIAAYDKLMTRYMSLAKKASKGDVSIVSEYESLASELEDYEQKLNKLEGKMTPAQAAKFSKIAAKQAQAAMDVAGDAAKMAGDAAGAAAEALKNMPSF